MLGICIVPQKEYHDWKKAPVTWLGVSEIQTKVTCTRHKVWLRGGGNLSLIQWPNWIGSLTLSQVDLIYTWFIIAGATGSHRLSWHIPVWEATKMAYYVSDYLHMIDVFIRVAITWKGHARVLRLKMNQVRPIIRRKWFSGHLIYYKSRVIWFF